MAEVTNDDWKMCLQWISELKILPPGHSLFRCTQLKQFANVLKDGVILCSIVNRISPGVISKQNIATADNSLYFALRNINLARQAIIDHLSFKLDDVFAESDLANLEDFHAVLVTLSRLSHLPRALALGAKAWIPTGHYNNVTEKLENLPVNPAPTDRQIPIASTFPTNSSSNCLATLYANIAARNDGEKSGCDELIVQPMIISNGTAKREYAIKKLINSEKDFVNSLKVFVTEVMQPSKNFMSDGQWSQIFLYIDQLYSLHESFSNALNNEFALAMSPNCKPLDLLSIWVSKKRDFLLYTKYKVQIKVAKDACDGIMKSEGPIHQQFLACCNNVRKAMAQRSFVLQDYFFDPIKRFLTYQLLLQAIAKYSLGENEKKNMHDSVAVVEDIQQCINESQHDDDILDRIGIVESAVSIALPPNTKLYDYGKLRIDGEVFVCSRNDSKDGCVRFVFLFDFILIICQIQPRQPHRYKLRDFWYIDRLEFSDGSDCDFRPHNKFKYSFAIQRRSGPNPQDQIDDVYIVAVQSEEERIKWMEALKQAQINLHPPGFTDGDHLFVIKTFDEPYECNCCGKLMAGRLFQGYECAVEYCKMICHKECIPKVQPQANRLLETVIAVRAYDGILPEHPRKLKTLKFFANDKISIWARSREQWGYGECRNSYGFFPLSYVSERCSVPPGLQLTLPQHLERFTWYVGEMARETAEQLLQKHGSGTFLVRQSGPNAQRPGEYAISLKYDARELDPDETHDSLKLVRHIRIFKPMGTLFSLSRNYPPFFATVADLISHYQRNSLLTVFPELSTTLKCPFF